MERDNNYFYLQSKRDTLKMYINKCTKCGAEFETKNPKRVICPSCLYPDKKPILNPDSPEQETSVKEEKTTPLSSYSTATPTENEERKPFRSFEPRRYDNNRPQQRYPRPQGDRPYNSDNRYDRNQPRPYNQQQRPYGQQQRPYNPQPRPYDQQRPHGDQPRPYNPQPRPYGGDQNRPSFPQRRDNRFRPQGGPPNRRPFANNQRQLLVNREQIAQIELLYKKTLPLPNPDIHEVIGNAIDLEPRKVFFGINLVRQKMMLPKLPFPKRKLAVSPDQLFAIKNLYEPLLPLPPIGCHKIIAAQLKMDEWRVHVGIGLVRKQMGLDRWNPERPDAPAEFKKQ